MKLPKTLVKFSLFGNSLLLLFEDGEVVKFCTLLEEIGQCPPSKWDLMHLGVISEEEWNAHLKDREREKEQKENEQKLLQAWYDYYTANMNYPKPTKYPREVQKIIEEIDWDSKKHDSVVIVHKGLHFDIDRP